jgi:hypothetical protein
MCDNDLLRALWSIADSLKEIKLAFDEIQENGLPVYIEDEVKIGNNDYLSVHIENEEQEPIFISKIQD